MTEKDMTVKELYETLTPLISDYGDLEVRVSYDSSCAATPIKHINPRIVIKPIREYSYVIFEGF